MLVKCPEQTRVVEVHDAKLEKASFAFRQILTTGPCRCKIARAQRYSTIKLNTLPIIEAAFHEY